MAMPIQDEQTQQELGQAGSSRGASGCAPVEGQCHPQRGLPTAPKLRTWGVGTMEGPGAKGMSLQPAWLCGTAGDGSSAKGQP